METGSVTTTTGVAVGVAVRMREQARGARGGLSRERIRRWQRLRPVLAGHVARGRNLQRRLAGGNCVGAAGGQS